MKNTNSARVAEGLPTYVDVRRGNPQALVIEGEATFEVNLAEGQKTGWFFDQADNRSRFPQLYRGARVLDLYSYVGAGAFVRPLRGASRVVCVDSSEAAVAATRENAQRNAVGETVTAVRADVSDFLKDHGEKYDVVILDPPALVKRRKDLKGAAALVPTPQPRRDRLPRAGRSAGDVFVFVAARRRDAPRHRARRRRARHGAIWSSSVAVQHAA